MLTYQANLVEAASRPTENRATLGIEGAWRVIKKKSEAEMKKFSASVRPDLLRFCAAALPITISDACLGLTDNWCVWWMSTPEDGAAVQANNVMCNLIMYILMFFSYITFFILSHSLPSKARDPVQRHLGNTMLAAVVASIFLIFVLSVLPKSFYTSVFGSTSQFWVTHVGYLLIRAFSLPAAIITVICLSARLQQKDKRTPVCLLLVAIVANVILNLVMLGIGAGTVGVAIVTALVQYAAASWSVWSLPHENMVGCDLIQPSEGYYYHLVYSPAVMFCTRIFKVSSLLLLQKSASAVDGLSGAANTTALSTFMLLHFVPEVLCVAAQSFIPPCLLEAETLWKAECFMWTLLRLGTALSLFLGMVTAGLMLGIPEVLSKDSNIWPLLETVGPSQVFATVVAAPSMVMNAILVARKDFILGCVAAVAEFVLMSLMLRAFDGKSWGSSGSWAALGIVQIIHFGVILVWWFANPFRVVGLHGPLAGLAAAYRIVSDEKVEMAAPDRGDFGFGEEEKPRRKKKKKKRKVDTGHRGGQFSETDSSDSGGGFLAVTFDYDV